MARLPQPGSDDGTWGQILNDYLSVSHAADGTIKANAVPASSIQDNAVTTIKIADNNVTDAKLASGISQSKITNLTSDLAGKEPTITAGTSSQYWRGDKSWQTLDKTAVGLENVDNTSDANKPVSTAQQTALNAKADTTITDALDTRIDTLESAGIVNLTDGATINTSASAGKHFRVSIAGDRILAAPTAASDGLRRIWEVTASGANRTLTLATGMAGSFELTTNITSPITINTGKTQFIGAIYNASRDRWTVIASQVTS